MMNASLENRFELVVLRCKSEAKVENWIVVTSVTSPEKGGF